MEKALLDFPTAYTESMNTVVTQELMRFNKLTAVIVRSLGEIKRALAGLIVLGGELEAMGNSIAIGQVPKIWSDAAYPSLKPLGSWVFDLIARLAFMQGWVDALRKPNLYWISGFYFTQAFLTGTLQNFARKYQIPIDEVAFDFAVLRPGEQATAADVPPEDGAVIHGLFLDSARFDVGAHCLEEAAPRELFAPVPYIHMLPRHVNDLEPVEGTMELYTVDRSMPPYQGGTCHVYMCPVYKTSVRYGVLSTTGHSTNFVIFIRVPMAAAHTQKHWIKRGVAMLCNLDD